MGNYHYKKIFESYYGIKVPKGYHIHHIDLNHDNNDPLNLELLTPDEHAQKHGYLTNFIMAQDRAGKVAIEKLRTPEIRKKMSESMKNSEKHKNGIKARSTNLEWRKNVTDAVIEMTKNRTNPPWNKGKKGVQIPSEDTRKKQADSQRGQLHYNDGIRNYRSFPELADPTWSKGFIYK